MDHPGKDRSQWEADAIGSLRTLKLNDIPGLELLLLDALVRWCVSDSNPGRDYGEQHAAATSSALLSAAESAGSLEGIADPDATEEIIAARTQVVAGAHELADTANGLTLLITRLMPTALAELTRHAGDLGAQVYWLYCYFLLALAGGRNGDVDETVLRGLMASFAAWNSLMAGGFVPPWRADEAVIGTSDQYGTRIEATGAQGVQIGDHNVQENKFISQYVETQVIQAPSAPVTWPVRMGDVPQQPPVWQPREHLLAAVGKQGPGVPIVRALTGMRGAGKTQIAAAYARSRMTDGWRLVAWVNAQDPCAVLNGLDDLALRLGIRDPGAEPAKAAAAVRHWLEASGEQCLLVFDDVSDLDRLRPFVPAAGDAQVVITSSHPAAADLGLPVPVDVFTPEEALAFLAERTGSLDASGARELAAELEYLPLAIAQAAAVIARQRLSYGTYVNRLRTLPVGEYLTRVEPDTYPRGTAATVILSMDSARAGDRSRLPGAILDLIAVLSAAGVNRKLLYVAGEAGALEQVIEANEVPAAVDASLAQLADASLLTFSMDGSSVRAHSLVMRVIRELRAWECDLAAAGKAAARALFTVSASVEPVWQHPDAARDLIQQSMALYMHVAPLLTEADAELLVELLVLRGLAVRRLGELGDSPTQEIEYIQPLLADYERFLGADHPDTLRTRSNLAVAYQKAGRIADAILLSERALADCERILGTHHAATVAARNNLAHAYQAAGRAGEAIPIYERILAERERDFGENHPDTLLSRNNLAHAYQAAGRVDEAIPMFEHILAERERSLGESHPYTLLSRGNLAASYHAARRIGEAIPLYERTLVDQEKIHRGDHPDTLALCNNLAQSYQAVGRLEDAISLYERTLVDCERVLGVDHPKTRAVREDLGAAQQLNK